MAATIAQTMLPLGRERDTVSTVPGQETSEQIAARASGLSQEELKQGLGSLRELATALHGAMLTHHFHSEPDRAFPLVEHKTQDDRRKLPGYEGLHWGLLPGHVQPAAEWRAPPHCIPIHRNVIGFDWDALIEEAHHFDAIVMDPPWFLTDIKPTRGVALVYNQLTDEDLQRLPIARLQPDGGLVFVWVINAKMHACLNLFDAWGYTMVDQIHWLKTTSKGTISPGHGYYLQHAKETLLVGRKNGPPHPGLKRSGMGDILQNERLGQSQKPTALYRVIESLFPKDSHFLEIFGRKNNLRNHWTSIGNEVTGGGRPAAEHEMRSWEEAAFPSQGVNTSILEVPETEGDEELRSAGAAGLAGLGVQRQEPEEESELEEDEFADDVW